MRDFNMCQEFRFAVIEMCLEALQQGRLADDGVIGDWLRGELRLVSALKPCLIFQKAVRHNARHILLSLAHWLRLAGKQGLVLTIDVGRYLLDRRPKEPDGFYYSRAATLEAYEVLRQFIDDADDAEGCFVVVFSPADFLTNELEFTYNRIRTPHSFLWRKEDIRRNAQNQLTISLLSICPLIPKLLLALARETESALFCRDIQVSLPVCRVAPTSEIVSFAAGEVQETVESCG